ncbi:MAG: ABC transporter ATP-binding protein [Planctomycetota bacterium]
MPNPARQKPWRQYVRLLRPESPDLKTIVVYGAASAVLALAVPLTVDALISNITFGRLLTPLVVLVGVLLGCLVLQALLGALQAWVVEIIERRIFVRVVGDLSWRLPRVDVAVFDDYHGPELVNRFFDTVTVQKSSSKLLLQLTNLVLTAGVGMIVLAFYHPFLLVFVLALLAAVTVIVFLLGVGGVRTAVQESAAKYEVGAWLQQLARHTTAFCTQGGAAFARDRADELCRTWLDSRRRHFRILFRQMLGAFGLQVIASTAVLGIGGWLVIDQQLTAGQLVASELIVTAVVASITKLGDVLENWYDVCAAADKLGKLIDLPLERQNGDALPDAERGARVELHGVHCHPGDDPAAGETFDLAVEAGERVALVGPVGGDASRLLDVLFGLRQPNAGHVTIDDLDLRQLRLDRTRDAFSLVHGTELVDGTVLDNIRFGRDELPPDAIRQALNDVCLWDELLALPDGLDTTLTVNGLPLDQSQMSRLMLARAIVGQPRLLLLDGALDALPPALRQRVMAKLFARKHTWTVLVVTLADDVIAACDRAVDLAVATPDGGAE